MTDLKQMFSETYAYNKWGSSESLSGPGSEWNFANGYAKSLVKIIKDYKIESIFDSSCGDWNWMRQIKEELPTYIGNDIVESVIKKNTELYSTDNIRFQDGDMIANLSKESQIDLVISRHTLEHLPTYYCIAFLEEVKNRSKYALITSGNWNDDDNKDLDSDGHCSRAINLDRDPYLSILGEPIEKIWDHPTEPSNNGTFAYLYKFV
jgi:hypothetical protein